MKRLGFAVVFTFLMLLLVAVAGANDESIVVMMNAITLTIPTALSTLLGVKNEGNFVLIFVSGVIAILSMVVGFCLALVIENASEEKEYNPVKLVKKVKAKKAEKKAAKKVAK
jgi:hypothetical protein